MNPKDLLDVAAKLDLKAERHFDAAVHAASAPSGGSPDATANVIVQRAAAELIAAAILDVGAALLQALEPRPRDVFEYRPPPSAMGMGCPTCSGRGLMLKKDATMSIDTERCADCAGTGIAGAPGA